MTSLGDAPSHSPRGHRSDTLGVGRVMLLLKALWEGPTWHLLAVVFYGTQSFHLHCLLSSVASAFCFACSVS